MIVKFSVVMPVFNRAGVVGSAIQSVLTQTHADFEFIIVNDGSTDTTEETIHAFHDDRIRYLKCAENAGVSAARNHGIAAARHEWIVFFDSDNQLLPDALAVAADVLREESARTAGAFCRSVAMDGSPLFSGQPPPRFGYAELLSGDIGEALGIVRRSIALNVKFDETLGTRRECSSLFWFAIARSGYLFLWIDDVLQRYDNTGQNRLSSTRFIGDHPADLVPCAQRLLERHGDDLRRMNPRQHIRMLQKFALYCFMAGERRRGFAACAQGLAQTAHLRHWTLAFLPISLCGLFPARLCRIAYRGVARYRFSE